MSTLRTLLLGFLAVAAIGCQGTINSSIPDGATIFEPQLLGTWTDSASRERATVRQKGPRSYSIRYTDDHGHTVSLVGRLGHSRERLILDVQPTPAGLGPYNDFVVRLHIPLILDSIGPRTRIAILEPDSLDRYLRTNAPAIAHARTHDGLVLTAGSPELERFFSRYLLRPGVLSASSTWLRRSP